MSTTTGHLHGNAAPVGPSERIHILDSLRGIAILGILLMNIPGFALPEPAYGDPSVLNEWGSINFKTWNFIDWSLEGSQRALFSMLFGAGIILFISRQEKKVGGLYPADYFFRRQLWLLVFGLINAFVLLWFWDILFHYACLGMIMFAFRRLPPKLLLIGAGICLLLMLVRENRDFYQDKKVIRKGEIAASIDTTVNKLTPKQKDELGAMMAEIALYYQREVEYDLKNLTDAMEPILLVSIAVMVLLLALAVYMPIWNMVKLVHK